MLFRSKATRAVADIGRGVDGKTSVLVTSQPLPSLCSINPESLGPATPLDLTFDYIDISAVSHGQISWHDVRRLKFKDAPSRARRRLRLGDVLLCTVRPALQAHARITDENGTPRIGSTGFAALRPNDPRDSGYLFHQLFSDGMVAQLRAMETGSNYPAVNERDVSRLRLFVPGADERARIAAVLDTVDAAIEKTASVIGKLKLVRAGLVHDLLTRGVGANGELRDPIAHPEQFKELPLGRIPIEWSVAPLVSRITFPDGQVDPRAAPYRDWTLLAPDHIESGTGRLLARRTAAAQDAISGKYVVERNDIVYSKIRPYLCKAVISDERCLCSADMYPLRPVAELVPRFLLAVVLGDSFTRFASAVSMRSGFPKINRVEMAEYRLAWPQTDEQLEIARILRSSDNEQAELELELGKLQEAKAGLMADLLSGRVRVPPDIETGVD